jgi:heterodisulfide reductase subunit B
MEYAIFLGCTIPARSRNYELSARKISERLGIGLVDLAGFVCCGFPLKASEMDSAELLAAYNLALAQQKGLDVCVLCSSCASALTETDHHLSHDNDARQRINERLAPTGVQYQGGVKVKHLARLLFEEVGAKRISSAFERDLGGLRVAVHYGCHYLKPSEVYEAFDEVEDPKTIDALVSLTGASVIDYPGKKKCCGGPILPVDEKVALSLAKEKLDDVTGEGAEALCLVCPFCSVMYDSNQKSIESEYGTAYNMPVLYLTQLIGLAMGFDRKELGLNMNVVKTKALLQRFFD